MTDAIRKINIQVYDTGIQLSTANGFNTERMTRKELQVLISDACAAHRELGDVERANKTYIKAVS